MKKVVATLLLFCLFISNARADANEAKDVLAFCEQFGAYTSEYNEYIDHEMDFFDTYSMNFMNKTGISPWYYCNAGQVWLNDTLGIERFSCDVIELSSDDNTEQVRLVYRAAIAMFCLEHDDDERRRSESLNQITAAGSFLINKVSSYSDCIHLTFTTESLKKLIYDKESILIYSGKYDYYISYFSYDAGPNGEKEILELTAKLHQN